MSVKDGGPAFAGGCILSEKNEERGYPPQSGMSLRDYFAGQALAAFGVSYGDDFGRPTFRDEARRAYECADAMLAARERQG